MNPQRVQKNNTNKYITKIFIRELRYTHTTIESYVKKHSIFYFQTSNG